MRNCKFCGFNDPTSCSRLCDVYDKKYYKFDLWRWAKEKWQEMIVKIRRVLFWVRIVK